MTHLGIVILTKCVTLSLDSLEHFGTTAGDTKIGQPPIRGSIEHVQHMARNIEICEVLLFSILGEFRQKQP